MIPKNPKFKKLRWTAQEKRIYIADQFKKEFLSYIRQTQIQETNPFVKSFQFVKGKDLLSYERLPRFQDIQDRLVPYPDANIKYFVSHRWLDISHPDPEGKQLKLLQSQINPEAYYWIDFSCLPQEPMTSDEHALLLESLANLPSLIFNINFIVLRCINDGYFERAWCFFEMLAANVLGYHISYTFEDSLSSSHNDSFERKTLEETLLNRTLPSHLKVAYEADLILLKELTKITTLYFELRVIEHYMILGQQISDGEFFRGEDPYYYLATCDFSEVILWVFDKAKEHQIPLVNLRHGYSGEDNFFVKIAEREKIRRQINPFLLSKRVTRDIQKHFLFLMSRNSPDPLVNIFVFITSMIR